VSLPDFVEATPYWLSLPTVAVAAFEGALIGRESRAPRFDVVGVVVLALVLGLTGGIARDLLLGNLPVVAIRTPWYLVATGAAALLVLLLHRHVPPLDGMWFVILDALALGLYTAVGTRLALDLGVSTLGALFVGVVAGIAGGVVVAMLRGTTPAILVPGIYYAMIALAGAVTYALVKPASAPLAAFSCVLLVICTRIIAVRFNLGTRALPLIGREPPA